MDGPLGGLKEGEGAKKRGGRKTGLCAVQQPSTDRPTCSLLCRLTPHHPMSGEDGREERRGPYFSTASSHQSFSDNSDLLRVKAHFMAGRTTLSNIWDFISCETLASFLYIQYYLEHPPPYLPVDGLVAACAPLCACSNE